MEKDIQPQRAKPHGLPMRAVGAHGAGPAQRAERFLLAAIREWRRGWEHWERDKTPVSLAALEAHFTSAGFGSAWQEFADAMEALLFYSRRSLDVRPPAAPSPSPDEKRLLTLCLLSQAGSDGLVMASLAVLMQPCFRPVVGRRLSLATAALRTAGLLLPPPAFKLRPPLH
ncbi:MAG: hypothetical protein ACOY4R_14305 [Pseudomonadota bacterium]